MTKLIKKRLALSRLIGFTSIWTMVLIVAFSSCKNSQTGEDGANMPIDSTTVLTHPDPPVQTRNKSQEDPPVQTPSVKKPSKNTNTGSGTVVAVISEDITDSVTVFATVYQGLVDQTDDTPNKTSIQAEFDPVNPPRWLAVSRDLLKIFPYGTGVVVTGAGVNDGVYIVMDTMSKRKSRQIDILISSKIKEGDPSFGSWKNVKLTKLYPSAI